MNLKPSDRVKFQGHEVFNRYLPEVKDRFRIKDDYAIASFVSYFEQKTTRSLRWNFKISAKWERMNMRWGLILGS